MSVVNARDYQVAFSLNKQSNIRTAVAGASVKYTRSIRGFAPSAMEPTNITDRLWFGKGHPFPTFVDRVSKLYRINAQERSATSLELLWALAYCLGGVVSTDMTGYFRHVITFVSTTTQKEPSYTSLIEKMGAEYQQMVSGVWINSVTLNGNRADHVVMSYEGGGRKSAADVTSMPETSAASFFKTLYGTVAFGNQGAAADISAEVLSYQISVNQNCEPLFLMGNTTGEEDLISKVLIGNQSISGNVVIMINAAHRNRFINQTECTLQLVLKSPDYCNSPTNTVQHTCTIDIPNVMIANEAYGTEGNTVAYTLNFGEDGILKAGAAAPITFTMLSDIDDTELLIAA
jgi:hypothetical protein